MFGIKSAIFRLKWQHCSMPPTIQTVWCAYLCSQNTCNTHTFQQLHPLWFGNLIRSTSRHCKGLLVVDPHVQYPWLALYDKYMETLFARRTCFDMHAYNYVTPNCSATIVFNF